MPTKIEWAEETWNPITGCTKVSEGCANCYAERMARRLAGRFGYPEAPHHFDVTIHENKMEQPLQWKKPRRIFVCSMGDLFHEDVPWHIIDRAWAKMAFAPQHTFLVLTKRPRRALRRAERSAAVGRVLEAAFEVTNHRRYLPNVWLGITAENQKRADERIPSLLSIPAAGHLVSLEPMLGPIDLTGKPPLGWGAYGAYHEERLWPNALTGVTFTNDGSVFSRDNPKIDHVIVGGESGPGARPTHPDNVRSVRDQCQEAGVPFLFKQWGKWWPEGEARYESPVSLMPLRESVWLDVRGGCNPSYSAMMHDPAKMWRVGKRAAGRLLDGELWDEYPEALQ